MTRITVLGGTGYTGANLLRAAVARGHDVTSYSRNPPEAPIDGVRYETGSLSDEGVRTAAVQGADVVVGALSAKAGLGGDIAAVYGRIAEAAAAAGARLGVVGGYSSLRPASGAPRFSEGDDLPPQFAAEAKAMAAVVDLLQAEAPAGLDWFFISPAMVYGAFAPGERIGSYRLGDDVALQRDGGPTTISGADFADAVLDEIETPTHHRAHFSAAQ
ncbi:NAD(P)-dependent oxidoreductase [uncultured Amnibacterium sp.]|uniref:NAD(P)-dependent oxidoreductase n=1 Tax=uncultured Amnibacterium sp. TaxID=1631851 RepID=UPI0035CB1DB7